MTDDKAKGMSLDVLKKLVAKVNKLPAPTSVEKNFFNIGGRGFYENPISDVLAFFCHTDGEHGLGDLVVRALFNALREPKKGMNIPLPGINDYSVTTMPERETPTKENKRIDILLEGKDWVMVIENKIYHHQEDNPFSKYEEYARERYSVRGGIEEGHLIYVVLSPSGTVGENTEGNWHGLSYAGLVSQIKKELGTTMIEKPFNKWLVLLRDFIINLQEFTMKSPTPKTTLEYIVSHIRRIKRADETRKETLQNFMVEIQDELNLNGESTLDLKDNKVSAKMYSWDGGYSALHFWLPRWGENSYAVLYPDGEGEPEGSEEESGKRETLSIWFGTYIDNEEQYDGAVNDLEKDGAKLGKVGKRSGWLWTKVEKRRTVDDRKGIVAELAKRLKQLDDYEAKKG